MIPFIRTFDFAPGRLDVLGPRLQRVIANNPGPFTFTGTGVYIIGPPDPGADIAVIDPGPDDDAHLAALLDAVRGRTVTAVLVTHSHRDHAPLARPFAQKVGAPVMAAHPPAEVRHISPGPDQDDDLDFSPDEILTDGQLITGSDWTLRTVATPGHASNHLAFWLEEERALFSGDHVMGWSTTVVAPPDGDMLAYLDSLRKVIDLDPAIIWPTHGPPVVEPRPFLKAYLDHRLERDAQILTRLAAGDRRISEMTPALYAAVDRKLWPAASLSIWAHLIALEKQGRVRAEPEPEIEADWILI